MGPLWTTRHLILFNPIVCTHFPNVENWLSQYCMACTCLGGTSLTVKLLLFSLYHFRTFHLYNVTPSKSEYYIYVVHMGVFVIFVGKNSHESLCYFCWQKSTKTKIWHRQIHIIFWNFADAKSYFSGVKYASTVADIQ